MDLDEIMIKGYVMEFIDGELVIEHPNAIHGDLRSLFGDWLQGNSAGVGIDSLFSSANVQVGSGEAGNDGIAVQDTNVGSNQYFTMETTVNNSSYNTNGVQWKGVMVSDSDRTISGLAIGEGFGSGSPFNNIFATIDKSGDELDLVINQTYEVLWGISPS